jgi:hypothetical protein
MHERRVGNELIDHVSPGVFCSSSTAVSRLATSASEVLGDPEEIKQSEMLTAVGLFIRLDILEVAHAPPGWGLVVIAADPEILNYYNRK